MSYVTNSAPAKAAVTFAAPAFAATKQLPIDQKAGSFATRLLSNITPYLTKQTAFYTVCAFAVPTALYFAYKHIPAGFIEYKKNNILQQLTEQIDALVQKDEKRLQAFKDGSADAIPEAKQYTSKEEIAPVLVAISAPYTALVEAAKQRIETMISNKPTELQASLEKAAGRFKAVTEALCEEVMKQGTNRQIVEGNEAGDKGVNGVVSQGESSNKKPVQSWFAWAFSFLYTSKAAASADTKKVDDV